MAYENTQCACGGKKLPDTFLCDLCAAHLRQRREMRDYQDPCLPVEARRHAATILLSLARRRTKTATAAA